MSSDSRARRLLIYLSVVITLFVLGQYLYCEKYSFYEVYINGNKIAYIEDRNDVYKAKESVEDSLSKRFNSIRLNDDIETAKVVIKPKNLSDIKSLKNSIIKNSYTTVPAVLMKSDGHKLGFLANENEMKQVLDQIKDSYKEKDKNGDFRLKNHITYVNEWISIAQLNSIDGVKATAMSGSTPLISFIKEDSTKEIHNVSLSRSMPISSVMYTPSRGSITSPFGERWGKMHNGIDIGSPMGSPIYAAMGGKVSCTEWEDGYGNIIKIDHGSNMQTFYAHCSRIDVKPGQFVKRGDKIGEVGSTGRSTGPHVHFEIRVNGVPQDPIKYFK